MENVAGGILLAVIGIVIGILVIMFILLIANTYEWGLLGLLLDYVREFVGLPPLWRLQRFHYLWAIRVAVAASFTAFVVAFLGGWLWGVLVDYIHPKTATERKDLVNIFVLIAAGVIGALTALAAVGNLYISRRNLRQQREIEEERAQGVVLQGYFEQMGKLLAEQKLMDAKSEFDPLRLLARAQTLTVLGRMDASRGRNVLLFLYGAGLINKDNTIVSLSGGDLSDVTLSDADLSGANLSFANLSGADLSRADLSFADLSRADLDFADLRNAKLLATRGLSSSEVSGVDLSGADLSDARLTDDTVKYWINGILKYASSMPVKLEGATMPNGQKYEDWLKSKGRTEDGENSGPSHNRF